MNNKVYLQNISVLAPGMPDWPGAQEVLTNAVEYRDEPVAKLVPNILPANERRRATQYMKLALHVAEKACELNEAAMHYASVFASSDGDFVILDKNTHALTLPGHPVSPTNFHNSVHNAAAGYWAIAANARKFSTSLSAGEYTFATGLIEAITYATVEQQPVLYVAYDYPPDSILGSVRSFKYPFAVGLILQTDNDNNSVAEINVSLDKNSTETKMENDALEMLRTDNAIARALPLLQIIAKAKPGKCSLKYTGTNMLDIEIKPCL